MIYSPGHHNDTKKTRAITLVSTRISSSSWQAFPVQSPDVSALSIATAKGQLLIINVYNDQSHQDTIEVIRLAICNARQNGPCFDHTLWAGDFNRHHPQWEDDSNTQFFTLSYLKAAQPLLDAITDLNLCQLLPKGIPMLRAQASGTYMRLDNVFGSPGIATDILSCNVHLRIQTPKTDHLPVLTHINFAPPLAHQRKRRN